MGRIEQKVLAGMSLQELRDASRAHARAAVEALPNMDVHNRQMARAIRIRGAMIGRPVPEIIADAQERLNKK